MTEERKDEFKAPYQGLSEKVMSAFVSRDPVRFYRTCLGEGVDPSIYGEHFSELYDQGRFESGLERKGIGKYFKNVREEGEKRETIGYQGLLIEARAEDVNSQDFNSNPKVKKASLMKCFPARFGLGGSQDLEAREYSKGQIGRIYLELLNEAKRLEREHRAK